mgnify:FL=1
MNDKEVNQMKTIKIVISDTVIDDKQAVKTVDRLQSALMAKYWDQFYKPKYGPIESALVQEGNNYYLFTTDETVATNRLMQIVASEPRLNTTNFEIDVVSDILRTKIKFDQIFSHSYYNFEKVS